MSPSVAAQRRESHFLPPLLTLTSQRMLRSYVSTRSRSLTRGPLERCAGATRSTVGVRRREAAGAVAVREEQRECHDVSHGFMANA